MQDDTTTATGPTVTSSTTVPPADAGLKPKGTPPVKVEGEQEQEEPKPFAVFPDAKSFQARMDREAKKLMQVQLKALGFEDEAALQKAAEVAKAAEGQKTEIEKANKTIAKLQTERDQAILDATERLIRAECLTQATAMNFIHPELAYRQAELVDVQIAEDGKVEGVDAALKALLKQYPDLAKSAAPSLTPTHPAGGQTPTGETDAERRRRYFGGQTSAFWSGGGMKVPEEK